MFGRIVPRAVAAAALLAACSDDALVSPAAVAGSYVLTTVSGQPVPAAGVVSGVIALDATGAASRRVQYGTPAAPGALAVATGTFVARDDSLVLNLTALGANPPAAVRWAAAREGRALTLRLRDPGDGRDVVEVYRRQ